MKATSYLHRMAACSLLFDNEKFEALCDEASTRIQELLENIAVVNDLASTTNPIDTSGLLQSSRQAKASWDEAKAKGVEWYRGGFKFDATTVIDAIRSAAGHFAQITKDAEDMEAQLAQKSASQEEQKIEAPAKTKVELIPAIIGSSYALSSLLGDMIALIEQDD